ncbi:hypothetical protein [Capsulimonas corticalis]|uniref:hypothetical protein n=1 Tax=Capsulimonas corticalis TaxID=2219043 RepID=UPI000F645A5D|nr:hypothetical protein [Capsulimonas corticalis]
MAYIFDHPFSVPAWHWDLNTPSWNEEEHNAQVVEYMTALFENAGDVLAPFSNAQLNQGFWLLASNTGSNHMYALLDEAVPWPSRKRCIEAMEQLFRQCFAQRCSSYVFYEQPGGAPESDALNEICYLWFDIIPIHGKPDEIGRRQVDSVFLDTIESILYIENDACRESGSHGMDLWAFYYPDRVASALERLGHHTGDPRR